MPKLLALLDQFYEQHGQINEQYGEVAGIPNIHDSQNLAALVTPWLAMAPATETVDKEMIPDLSSLFDTTGIDSEAAANAEFDINDDDHIQPDTAVQVTKIPTMFKVGVVVVRSESVS